MNRHRLGLWLLFPGLLIFAFRGLLQSMGDDPSAVPLLGPATGLGGALSLIGLVLVAEASRQKPVLLGAATALVSHFAVTRFAPDAGAGFVYFGTALVLADRKALVLVPGLLAFLGTLLREATPWAHGLVAGGSLLLALAVVERAQSTDMHSQT